MPDDPSGQALSNFWWYLELAVLMKARCLSGTILTPSRTQCSTVIATSFHRPKSSCLCCFGRDLGTMPVVGADASVLRVQV